MAPHSLRLLLAAICSAIGPAAASCGAAFCVVNTDWSSQGAWTEPGAHFDLRYEFIDLDQPRNGRADVAVGAIPRHHDEVETKNRNVVATLDFALPASWAATVSLPYVDREHLHYHNHHGERIEERWHFREIGDLRAYVRRALFAGGDAESPRSAGIGLGLKLPTGKYDVRNAAGEEAERTLQPGTGTTDALLEAFCNGASPLTGWSWFARAQAVLPMNSRADFRPGALVQVDAGTRYAASGTLAWMLQANAQWKDRDKGANAEPEDSGQRAIFLTPGASWSVSRDMQLYAFVQVPVYQAVNGVQLTAAWSALAGVSWRF